MKRKLILLGAAALMLAGMSACGPSWGGVGGPNPNIAQKPNQPNQQPPRPKQSNNPFAW